MMQSLGLTIVCQHINHTIYKLHYRQQIQPLLSAVNIKQVAILRLHRGRILPLHHLQNQSVRTLPLSDQQHDDITPAAGHGCAHYTPSSGISSLRWQGSYQQHG